MSNRNRVTSLLFLNRNETTFALTTAPQVNPALGTAQRTGLKYIISSQFRDVLLTVLHYTYPKKQLPVMARNVRWDEAISLYLT